MKNKQPTVVLTGCNGKIGQIIFKHFKDSWNIYGIDTTSDKKNNIYKADISKLKQVNDIFQKIGRIDFIIHLAADPSVVASWESVLKNNIVGTYNIYTCAKQYKVKKVILASTNRVTAGYEGYPPSLHKQSTPKIIRTHDPVRPNGFYASSKIFCEVLARQYFDLHKLSSICLRIGSVLKDDKPIKGTRSMKTWLSHRDLLQLVEKSTITNTSFGIYYGVSSNKGKFWDISNAKKELGYLPKDDAYLFNKNNK